MIQDHYHDGRYTMDTTLRSTLQTLGPAFTTEMGMAFCEDSSKLMKHIPDGSVDLIVTSPPFALTRPKAYGNADQGNYIDWFMSTFLEDLLRILKQRGSLVIDIGGSYKPGLPVRSLYHFELALELEKRGLKLAQEFYWYNPAKLPAPIEWVNVQRIRVKDSVNPVWWFSKDPDPKANNRNVLKPYTEHMRRLIQRGTYNEGPRDSEHVVGSKWARDNSGAIPDNLLPYVPEAPEEAMHPTNLLVISNTSSNDLYSRRCRELNIRKHPARFPLELPAFFIKFLTSPGDIVFDPFGGSCATGRVAEDLGRQWVTSEIKEDYVQSSQLRFLDSELRSAKWAPPPISEP